jgi:hypothetical protein
MLKYMSRLAAIVAVVPISLALSATPSPADTAGGVTLSGTASCNADTGHATWTLHWTILNNATHVVPQRVPQVVFDAIQVNFATESGLVDGDITDAVTPNPIPGGGTATATDGPVPNAVGDVTLDIGWSSDFGGVDGNNTATVHLDGTCVLVEATTVAPTTAPPAVNTAVAAAPAFTG